MTPGLREDNLRKLKIMKLGKEIRRRNEDQDRCVEDEYLCKIQTPQDSTNDNNNNYNDGR